MSGSIKTSRFNGYYICGCSIERSHTRNSRGSCVTQKVTVPARPGNSDDGLELALYVCTLCCRWWWGWGRVSYSVSCMRFMVAEGGIVLRSNNGPHRVSWHAHHLRPHF